MRSYSADLRIRFLRAVAAGASARAAARRFDIAPTTAIRWARIWRESGDHCSKRRGRPPGQGRKLTDHAAFLLNLVNERRRITLHEVAERLAEERSVCAAVSTIWRFYARHGIRLKKGRARRRAATGAVHATAQP